MRGSDQRPGELFSYVDLEQRIRLDHPLRAIRALTDTALAALSGEFAALYSGMGRPSIAPEMLLRAMQLRSGRSAASASPAAPCSRNSTGRISSPCPASPMPLPNGGCAGSASITTSKVEAHFYSVPYRFARSEVEVWLTPRTVEVFLKGERIAAHLRSSGNHRHTTVPEHMPSSHRRYAD